MLTKILACSLLAQPLIWLQDLLYRRRIRAIQFSDENAPVFILGHWRSGTTHLHYLLAQDPGFGTMNNYMAFAINVFLVSRGWLDRLLAWLMPERRPMDNVEISINAPQEEEQCTGNLTTATGIHALFFPRNRIWFDRFVVFRNTTPAEKIRWQQAYHFVLQTVAYAFPHRRVLSKNPCNTSRVRELLELYPRSKFIFVHRDPVDVFLSTRNFYQRTVETQFLQDADEAVIVDNIIDFYSAMMQKYLQERTMIPAGNLIEISFEELIRSPEQTVRRIYSDLSLSGFESAEPHFQQYLKSVEHYEQNRFAPLSPELQNRIRNEWGFAQQLWGRAAGTALSRGDDYSITEK